MKLSNQNDAPGENWGLDRLGKFCVERHQRMASDAWLIGKAMCLAKGRCKNEGKQFTTWKREHGFSDATTSRYMRLCEDYPTDEDFQRLKTVGMLEAYVDAGIEAPRVHNPRQASAKRCATSEGKDAAGEPQTSQVPSWVADDKEESSPDQNITKEPVPVWKRHQCLEKELREVVPQQVQSIKDTVADVLEYDLNLLLAALPTKKCEKEKIATEIGDLVRLLSRLAAIFREQTESLPAVRSRQEKGKRDA